MNQIYLLTLKQKTMFKQTIQPIKETIKSTPLIDRLDAVTSEQLAEFAKLTGRFGIDFKVGKPTNISVK